MTKLSFNDNLFNDVLFGEKRGEDGCFLLVAMDNRLEQNADKQ